MAKNSLHVTVLSKMDQFFFWTHEFIITYTVCFGLENFSETFLEKNFVGCIEIWSCFFIFLVSKYFKWSTRTSSWCPSDAPRPNAPIYPEKTALKIDFWNVLRSRSKLGLKNLLFNLLSLVLLQFELMVHLGHKQ